MIGKQMLLTNGAYWPRTSDPLVIAVLHITANLACAVDQRAYANRANSSGPSATVYVDRDGGALRALDPRTQVAWGQGDVAAPDTSNGGVRALIAAGNANRGVYETVEVVDDGTGWTDAQFETVAGILADAAVETHLPLDRNHVLTHRDLNTVNRPSDPWPAAVREANMARLLARARALSEPEMQYVSASGYGVTSAKRLHVTASQQLYTLDGREFVTMSAGADLVTVGLADGHSGQYVVLVSSAKDPATLARYADGKSRPVLAIARTGTLGDAPPDPGKLAASEARADVDAAIARLKAAADRLPLA